MRLGSISSELLICGGGVRSMLLLPRMARCLETIDVCIWRKFVFMSVVVIVWRSVGMLGCVAPLLKIVGFSLGVCMLYVCVRDVMNVVFSVCIMTRAAVGARVWEV